MTATTLELRKGDKFIVVEYYNVLDEVLNIPCRKIKDIESRNSVGVWKNLKLKK